MIEVLSPGGANARRDRVLKLDLYAREGVAEFWLIDPQLWHVEVYRRSGAEFRLTSTLTDQDELTSPLLPGFRYAVRRLWTSPRPTSSDA
jgi:Uma2 family endonuclease